MTDRPPPELADAERLLRDGEARAALERATRALLDGADEPGWLRLRALALAASGLAAEARSDFLRYALARPDEADAWVNLGTACLDCGDAASALDALQHATMAGATGLPYLLAQGLALSAAGRHADALPWLDRAQALEPSAPDIRLARGQCLAELERWEDLQGCVDGIGPSGLGYGQRTVLAWLLAQAGNDPSALALYRELVAERPCALAPRVQLALLLERLNRVQEAVTVLSVVDPGQAASDSTAALVLARVARRQGAGHAALGLLGVATSAETDPAMSAQLWFERARCHDAEDQPDAAMQALAAAHRQAAAAVRQRHPRLRPDRLLGWLQQRLARPLANLPAPPCDAEDLQDPVFLVGFPRSGTTLLEQLLAGHPSLRVLDERPALEAAIAAMRALPGWRDANLDASLALLDATRCRQLRALYRREVHRYLPPGGRLVDKYPLSLTRVGHAQRLFPRADWVLLLRHPCDCVLSCHMQAFGLNGGALAFASLESTARTYAAVMAYWEEQRALARPRVHSLRYEDLVADPVAAVDTLMAFLGLSPVPAQHDFPQAVAARPTRIGTPSYAQVAEPVHARAVGRWRRYRAHFTPAMLDLLAPFAARYGYALD